MLAVLVFGFWHLEVRCWKTPSLVPPRTPPTYVPTPYSNFNLASFKGAGQSENSPTAALSFRSCHSRFRLQRASRSAKHRRIRRYFMELSPGRVSLLVRGRVMAKPGLQAGALVSIFAPTPQHHLFLAPTTTLATPARYHMKVIIGRSSNNDPAVSGTQLHVEVDLVVYVSGPESYACWMYPARNFPTRHGHDLGPYPRPSRPIPGGRPGQEPVAAHQRDYLRHAQQGGRSQS